MRRVHFFEIHEQPWCPEILRCLATDYLHTVTTLFRAYDSQAPRLRHLLERGRTRRIIDLCSGGGGPSLRVAELAATDRDDPVSLTFTDLYPNPGAFDVARLNAYIHIDLERAPVDARAVPAHLAGVRTLFDAFHHFKPDEARAILRDAVDKRVPILVAEGTERSLKAIIGMLLTVPLLVLALTPLVRPFRISRILLTYVLPLAPLLILFDGVVSCLRTYSPAELRELSSGLAADDYEWQTGQDVVLGRPVTWLAGEPVRREEAPAIVSAS
jgi:hypothetical protein